MRVTRALGRTRGVEVRAVGRAKARDGRVKRAPHAKRLLGERESPRKSTAVHGQGPDQNKQWSKITRANEPDEYWRSNDEKSGKTPFQDPLAIIFSLTLIVPFGILGIAIATGYIDIS